MTVDHDLSRERAQALLTEVGRLRGSTRQAWGSPWFALVCFGGVGVIAAAALATVGSVGLVMTWAVAGAGALVLVGRYYRRRGASAGLTGRAHLTRRWALAVFAACFVAAAATGRAHERDAGIVASILVVLVSYLAFGAWQRRAHAPIATAVAALPALILAVLAAAPWVVELAFGLGLIMAGASLRVRTSRA